MTIAAVTPDVSNVENEPMDEFGRTEAERTIVLLSAQAEAINTEVSGGKHDSYDEALAYVIERGFKEIGRQRESARKQDTQRKTAVSLQKFNDVLAKNPSLAADPKALVTVFKATGAWSPAIEAMLKAMGVVPNA